MNMMISYQELVRTFPKVLKIMDEDKIGKSDDDSIILKVTKNINGADKGIAERKIATKKAKEMIDDEV
ncbi:hypothetical protein [Klebsiella pneumoniae]|uniref:hypothetical protein n=1 Tax=Klebsiella pneumoniae TaxID=573 RepID=UPI0023AA3E62|nr:hypothetical protein [Klebsiella pneumoniae]WEE42173.1 hypothetical protein PXG74_14395 [Klebsiella pneumoniae]